MEYLPDGKLVSEREYLNGKEKGKEYYYDSKLKYEGEYINGKRNEKEKNIIIIVNYNMKENI